ncbi:hypothetical protein IPM62_02020 [Candidatus Woesebacteria bacterium]|nr:MAG: hypothetical protein IPM62_02020 [Candidatus Woesebacteria bacterium]
MEDEGKSKISPLEEPARPTGPVGGNERTRSWNPFSKKDKSGGAGKNTDSKADTRSVEAQYNRTWGRNSDDDKFSENATDDAFKRTKRPR